MKRKNRGRGLTSDDATSKASNPSFCANSIKNTPKRGVFYAIFAYFIIIFFLFLHILLARSVSTNDSFVTLISLRLYLIYLVRINDRTFVTQKNAAKALAASVARQTVSLAFQQARDITGDYVAAQNIQFFVNEFAEDVQGLAGSVAAMGTWGALMWGIGETVKAGFHTYNYYSDIKKNEAQVKFNQQRVYGTTIKS